MPNELLKGTSILLVEDNLIVALELRRYLEDELGCSRVLGPVGTTKKALALLDSERPDGAIVDLYLQGELALPLIERLVEMGIPHVFFSGQDQLLLPPELQNTPMIKKPYNSALLVSTIKEMINPAEGKT